VFLFFKIADDNYAKTGLGISVISFSLMRKDFAKQVANSHDDKEYCLSIIRTSAYIFILHLLLTIEQNSAISRDRLASNCEMFLRDFFQIG